jgi:hypothetical protein
MTHPVARGPLAPLARCLRGDSAPIPARCGGRRLVAVAKQAGRVGGRAVRAMSVRGCGDTERCSVAVSAASPSWGAPRSVSERPALGRTPTGEDPMAGDMAGDMAEDVAEEMAEERERGW